MKQTTKFLHIFMCMALGVSVALTSCQDYDDDIESLQTQIDEVNASIDDILAKIEAGQFVQKVEKIENGLRVTLGDGTTADIVNGQNGKDGVDGQDGQDGQDGKDGAAATIEINNEGYWVINGVPTNVKAQGEDGKDGADGADGQDGQDGTNGTDGKDGASAYDLYLESLPEDATPLTKSEWLRTVAPRINETTGNWEIFDLDQNKWVDTEISAAGTDMYVTEVADKSGWMLHATVNGEATEIFLPAMPASGLSLVYRSMAADPANTPESIYSLYDNDGVMRLTSTTDICFKLFGNNIEENQENFTFFYDVYQTTKAGETKLEVVGKPIIEKDKEQDFYTVTVKTQASNFALGANYKTSLNIAYASEDNNSNVASSEYFNIQTAAIVYPRDVYALLEKGKEYVALDEQTIEFVYNEGLNLLDTIYPGFTENKKAALLPFEEVKAEFTIVEEDETTAELFSISEDGVVTAGNSENDPSAAINYDCEMNVRFYFEQNGAEVTVATENFLVKAVRAAEPLPEAVVMYNKAGGSEFQLAWSSLEAPKAEIALHTLETGLYAQFGGRDGFIEHCVATPSEPTTFYLYSLNNDNEYELLNGATLTWKAGATAIQDVFEVNVEKNTVVKNGTYYVHASNTLADPTKRPNITTSYAVPVAIKLGVDLEGSVTPNPYSVDEEGNVTVQGVTAEYATYGTHEMTANLNEIFMATPAFELKYTIAEDQAEDIAAFSEDELYIEPIETKDGIDYMIRFNPNDPVDLEKLSSVKIKIEPVGYTGDKYLNGLQEGGIAELRFQNPISQIVSYNTIADIPSTQSTVVDLSGLVKEVRDLKGHLLVQNGKVVGYATDEKTEAVLTKDWASTYGITQESLKLTVNIPEYAQGFFSFDGDKLTYTSGLTIHKDIEITVTSEITTKWGTIKAINAASFKVTAGE